MLEQLFTVVIRPILSGFVAAESLAQVPLTGTALVAKVEGDVKHTLRGYIGFGVDILFADGAFKTELDSQISAAIANAPANPLAALEAAAAAKAEADAAAAASAAAAGNSSESAENASGGV